MGILEDQKTERIDNVRTMAARIAVFGEGFSIREYLDALALSAGTLIGAIYRGPAKDIAVDSFIAGLRRAVQKRGE